MKGEFQAIEALFRKRVPFCHETTYLSNGDDASVHDIPAGFSLAISTDTAVEGVHWPSDMPLDVAAKRAVCAALSDLAAMGAKACWIWLSVVARDQRALQDMSDGVVEVCQQYQLELAGGDTVSAAVNMLNVTVGGLLPQGKALSRTKALVGDDIWLLGDVGLSAQGLEQWLNGDSAGDCITFFQHIQPQLEQGEALLNMGVLCCMDISDGLLQDASHLAAASQVGLWIEQEKLKRLKCYEKTSLSKMLAGGEDYALLCTAPVLMRRQLLQLQAQRIGSCHVGNAVKLMHQGQEVKLEIQGYDHFA
ncbi:MAG: thiamine-phosphate kinase [Mariprofundaceae bacterium]|nr:thiamine-phosphate kinase [Mariprofundaceae bacterium]